MHGHTSDWEHIVVRFVDGAPTAVFLSQHGRGEAYTYDAIAKEGRRPVAFTSLGTHAMRPVVGKHTIYAQYVYDYTDAGPRWDPGRNHLAFHYSEPNGKPAFEAAEGTDYPTAWLHTVRRIEVAQLIGSTSAGATRDYRRVTRASARRSSSPSGRTARRVRSTSS